MNERTTKVTMSSSGVEKLVEALRSGALVEYDIQPMMDSPDELFRIEQEKYLLVNKLLLKNLYFKWRGEFLAQQEHRILHTSVSLDELSRLILIVNPNLLSAWSYRKHQLMISRKNDESNDHLVTSELSFCRLVLMKHVKCEPAYVHRRWLVRRTICDGGGGGLVDRNLVLSELKLVVECLAPKIKSNYYCWTYFIWLLQLLDASSLVDYAHAHFTANALLTNPSDFCVFNARLQLLKNIFEKTKNSSQQLAQLVVDELATIDDILIRCAAYSTTWNYTKYFYLFLNQNTQIISLVLGSLDIDKLDNELTQRFLKNLNGYFCKLDPNEIKNLDLRVEHSESQVVKYMLLRQLMIARVIVKLYESNEKYDKIRNLEENFRKFFQKFLIL